MKVTIDIDCTPVEVRALFGLPDLSAAHEAYAKAMAELAGSGASREAMEAALRGWAPMGEAGAKLWSGLMEGLAAGTKR